MKKPKTLITYGTFDLLHIGHLNLLENLANLCDRLVVGVSTDEFNALKGKKCVVPYEDRARLVQSLKVVDLVIPETDWAQKRSDIITHEADIFAIGNDWAGKFDDLQDIVQVLYLPRTDGISTTEIKDIIAKTNDDKLLTIKNTLEHALSMFGSLTTK
ncbi:adenylyltransferase/cytidyltransferase family protein [Pseudomonas sp. TWI672]|uniref:adenylyltransferase/cytidyltransferase family protein n=1 Tax=unclassified Pseudomonas TaxID=196821 RepID=UPI002ACCF8D5|nr:adenylyltransferase/cytidyltransferase family protein [Pseudomonas putida]HEN8715012.1 adenylyltransferase/cytidyltransferase family protein [Pseudomonas putida]